MAHVNIPLAGRVPLSILLVIAVELGLTFIYLVNMWFGRPLGPILSDQFDLDGERNIPAWFSTVQLFLVSMMFMVLASASTQGTERVTFWILSLLFLALSCDESVGIHEKLGVMSDAVLPGGDRRNTPFVRTGIWVFWLGIPFIAVVISIMLRLRRFITDRVAIRLYGVGFAIFIGSAVGIETLVNFLVGQPHRIRIAQVAVEEFGEMVGVTLIVWATFRLMEAKGFHAPRSLSSQRPDSSA